MQSVGSFFSTVSKFYNEINPATLSGAIDVVVVEDPNGELACSPFHVRFGKLSILRPQEKVVEVTINGRVVDFPMKVGDAGEAFFVFETEQEVPEEFATSPLAGPSEDKVEEEIDFLDLAQESGHTHSNANINNTSSSINRVGNNAAAPVQDEQDTGYVSAHSGHGSEFEEDDQESPSPEQTRRQTFTSAVTFDDFNGLELGRRGANVLRNRLSISISLPSSPVLKGRDILENLEPVDSAGPLEKGRNGAQDQPGYQPSTQVFSGKSIADSMDSKNNGFLRPHRDEMIMDMTGYKTDDSAETDLDSEGPSEEGTKIRRARRKRGRVTRSTMGFMPYDAEDDQFVKKELLGFVANEGQQTDPRLPLRPLLRSSDRPLPGVHMKKRASSLPNLREPDVRAIWPQRLALAAQSPSSPPKSVASSLLKDPRANGSSPSSSTASSPPPSQDNGHHHRHQQRIHQDETGKTYSRRHSHKPTEQVHTKKPMPRLNPALNALSDTELEYQTPRTGKAGQDTEWTWGWGSLPVKNDSLDEMADVNQELQGVHVSIDIASSSSSPRKPVLSEMDIDGILYRIAISLCPGDDFGKDLEASEALFATNQITFDDFAKDPLKILNTKSLVCLINDRYFTWAAAGPYLASLVLFKRPLSDETLHQLSMKDARHLSDRSSAQQQQPTRFGVLSRWLRGSQAPSHMDVMEQHQPHQRRPPNSDSAVHTVLQKHGDVAIGIRKRSDDLQISSGSDLMTRSTSMPIDAVKSAAAVSDDKQQKPFQLEKAHSKRYAKTLRLTSEQLRTLNLKKGANTLTFSVTSSYQGKAVCSAKLFLWDHDFQVVISDIDGTITKSDALGHIFTMAGKDWTHTGIAKLYTDIANNGYHFLYLTSRAIGQADYTRKYLKGVEQDNYQLPDGPVIMSPDRLMTAFHREVILRRPEEFKMACLRDIKRLFGDRSPFYAGFGNRITDALSYRSVSVPASRIYQIDSNGEVKLELLVNYKSSYVALNDLVHEIFPGKQQAPEFNDWNYWKPTLPTIELPLAPSVQPILPPPSSSNSDLGSGSSRLGVIRSFTSSFTSVGPLKKRPSIPTFNSTPSTPPSAYLSSQLSPRLSASPTSLTSYSSASLLTAPASAHLHPRPPISAPAGLQIADRTRRLSLSLMKYGSNSGSAAPPNLIHPADRHHAATGSAGGSEVATAAVGRTRGMSMNSSSSRNVASNVSMSPPTSYSSFSNPSSADKQSNAVHPMEIRSVKRTSSFSVSPPQIASRFTETVIPFLRGRASKSEQGQGQQNLQQEYLAHAQNDQQVPEGGEVAQTHPEGSFHGYVDDPYEEEEDGDHGYVEGGEYEEEYEEGEEDLLDDDDDDVELNIDAPFL